MTDIVEIKVSTPSVTINSTGIQGPPSVTINSSNPSSVTINSIGSPGVEGTIYTSYASLAIVVNR